MVKSNTQVFLSYSQRDQRVARSFVRALEQHGLSVWYDDLIPSGSDFAKAISDALKNSTAMIVLLSPDYVASQLGKREIEYALTRPRFENRVFPVLVRPTREVPWILREFLWVDATKNRRKATDDLVQALRSQIEVGKT